MMQQARALFGGNTQRRQAPQAPRVPISLPPPKLSHWSTPAVQDSSWCSHDFMLGAGMVIIQQNTHKILVVHETKKNYYFFPRGRKDIGESLEQTALREAYEESGYRAEFLPLLNPTHQPRAPGTDDMAAFFNTEPIFIITTFWPPKRRGRQDDHGGEYLTTWYAGQIAEDAVHEENTGMPDEKDYRSVLLTFDEASKKIRGSELRVLNYVWTVYCGTMDYLLKEQQSMTANDTLSEPEEVPETAHY